MQKLTYEKNIIISLILLKNNILDTNKMVDSTILASKEISRLDSIEIEVNKLKTEIKQHKTEIKQHKDEITTLKGEVKQHNDEINSL